MNLNIVSDWPLVDSYLDVLRGARDSLDAPFKYFTLVADEGGFDDGPVLVLGRPEIKLPKDRRVGHAPSVRETLNTPGGGTKLTQVLGWLSRKEGQVPITWYFADDTDAPVWNGELTAVDIEVSGDITVDEPEDTELLSVALAHWITDECGIDRIEAVVYSKELLDNAEWCADLHDALNTNTLLTHNGKFDFRWINALLDTTLYPDEDTILMSHALYPGAQDHGLKSVAKRLFGAPDWDAGLKEYLKGRRGHYERVPNDILCEYNVLDVYWTLLIYDYLKERIVDTPQEWLYRSHTLPASHMMQDIEAWGMEIDQKYLKKLERSFTTERDRLLTMLHELAGSEFNPASPKQLKEILHGAFGWRAGNTQSATLRTKVMETSDEKLAKFVGTLLAYRKVSKSLSTYVLGIQKRIRRGRVHTTFLLHGPTTGRTSSRGPNLQNVTNDGDDHLSLRRMFIPNKTKNYKLIGADYAQAELRTMAELSNDTLMIKHLQRDAPDFFDNMMPHVFPEIDFGKMDKAHRKPYRLKLKRVVYGSSYGLTCHSISNMLTLEGQPTSKEEAARIQDGYLGLYKGLSEWRESVLPRVLDGHDLLTPFGRRFQQDVVTDSNVNSIQNQAWSFMPQGVASDIAVRAAMAIHNIFKSHPDRDIHLCALVHDAIYAEAPEEWSKWASMVISEQMEAAAFTIFKRVPFLVDTHIGDSWDEC